MPTVEARETRILVLAPSARDGRVATNILEDAGVRVASFGDLRELCEALPHGAGAVLVAEEAVLQDREGHLAAALARQPAWSDLPVLVLTSGGERAPSQTAALNVLGNVTLVDRPVRIATLISTVRSALRARARQYQLRRHLEERELAERALAESEARYRVIGETIPFGAWTADADGKLTWVSDTFLALLGMTQTEATERGWHHHAAPADRARLTQEWASGIAGGALFDIECDVVATSGEARRVQVRGAPLRGDDGAVRAWVGMHLDVTDKRRLEEEFARIGRLESVALLAGGIAHDFNNILTAILANVSLVKRLVPAGNPALPRVEAALRAGTQARGLVHQLLTFAKGGAPVLQMVHLHELLPEAVAFALQGSGVRAEVTAARPLWSVEADPAQLTQVIHNLVINAAQAMEGIGLVRIVAQNVVLGVSSPLPLDPGRYVRVSVVDHGRGIPPDALSRIFDLFYTTRSGGSGIGLAICHSVVQRHGGHITVRSTVGEGTTFDFYLPSADQPTEEVPVESSQAKSRAPRVLLMDDDDDVRDAAREGLLLLGYDVEEASDGVEAIERYEGARARGAPFAAVMLDLTVPGGMGGRETMERLRAIDPSVRAIVASGYSNDPVMSDHTAYGFRAALAKPFDLDAMESVLASVLADVLEPA